MEPPAWFREHLPEKCHKCGQKLPTTIWASRSYDLPYKPGKHLHVDEWLTAFTIRGFAAQTRKWLRFLEKQRKRGMTRVVIAPSDHWYYTEGPIPMRRVHSALRRRGVFLYRRCSKCHAHHGLLRHPRDW